ncbi:hypothetical protein [Alteromonas sp. MmMcT2-5]|uniref:hypothetical protein n=1 Tax=Alteromonas sp. MmMcT2-5 TaxID=2917733 RepID=UPI001EF1D7CB|nr:hypothetical protein [Alteromonas sp. MmMcT2-5]MCG7650073.1 hypothetical protein [Alteromonas sp. MmMcT2-5]
MDDMALMRRNRLIRTAKSNKADSAHIKFIFSRLNRGSMALCRLLGVCSKQGFTPSATRSMLSWMEDCEVVEYEYSDSNTHVQLRLTVLGKRVYINEVQA